MDQSDYTDDIEVLDAIGAVRTRPERYVGPLDSPAAINTLLTESLCIAFDNASSGCATEIAITFHADGSASVRDNGPGMNVEVLSNGSTAIEMLLTKLYVCREAKRNRLGDVDIQFSQLHSAASWTKPRKLRAVFS